MAFSSAAAFASASCLALEIIFSVKTVTDCGLLLPNRLRVNTCSEYREYEFNSKTSNFRNLKTSPETSTSSVATTRPLESIKSYPIFVTRLEMIKSPVGTIEMSMPYSLLDQLIKFEKFGATWIDDFPSSLTYSTVLSSVSQALTKLEQ